MKRIYHKPLLCRCYVFAEQNPKEYKINHMILIKNFTTVADLLASISSEKLIGLFFYVLNII